MLSLPDIRSPFLLLQLLLPFSPCPVAVGDLPLIWARVAGFVQGRKFKLCATLWHFHNFAYETWLWSLRVSRYRCALCHVFRILFYSVLFFILLCCCDRCSLLLPLMQNFNFSLIPVVGLVVRIVCQLFPSSQPVFGNKRACYKFSANICWTAGQKVGQHGGYLIMLQPQLIAMDRLHCIKEKERERDEWGGWGRKEGHRFLLRLWFVGTGHWRRAQKFVICQKVIKQRVEKLSEGRGGSRVEKGEYKFN